MWRLVGVKLKSAMPITTKAVQFGGGVDLPFRRPDPFNSLVLSEFANRIAEVLLLPVQADQFRVRVGDALYWYELVGSFLGDNVQFKKTAERATLVFKNGRVAADVQFIGIRTARFIQALGSGDGQQVILTAFCHASCASLEERDRFLSPFAIADSVVGPGLTGRVRVTDWPEPIKVNIEASFLVSGGLFVAWETAYTSTSQMKATQDDQQKMSELIGASFETAAGVFGLKLEFA